MKDLISTLFNILGYTGKAITIFRNIVFNILFLLLIVVIVVAIFSKEEIEISQDNALLLSLVGNVVEEKQLATPLNQLSDAAGISELPQETLLQDVLDAIHAAADDKRISSIILDMANMGRCSANQIHDIGRALQSFRASGKPVIAAEDFYSQNKYLLASYADTIYLDPAGFVELHGLGVFRLYFQEALEKLKVNYNIFRVGTYKSAVEPLTRKSMSEEARNQNAAWLGTLWNEYRDTILRHRDISPQQLDTYTNNVASLLRSFDGDTARLALGLNLVDELKTRHELLSTFQRHTGFAAPNDYRHIRLAQYLRVIDRSYTAGDTSNDNIGIIVAQGNIVPGLQPPGTIGSDSLLRVLRMARDANDIKAVVLRINSGGGSVFASEIIRNEIQELRKSGKPVVVSMGSVAASGGYWIAAEADEIWAYPSTLTGSIGIFGAIPTFERSLESLGIYSDGVGTTALSSGLNLTQPLSKELKDAIQLNIEFNYNKFLSIVSRGRQISRDRVEALAEGRVFDGLAAKRMGLVDKIGNLAKAVDSAADMAGLSSYSTRYIKKQASFSQMLAKYLRSETISSLINSVAPSGIFDWIGISASPTSELLLFNDPKGVYSHCLLQYN